jgi:hypothetical protein
MTTLNAKLCVLMAFWIAARRSPSVYVANLTLMPGYCFAKLGLGQRDHLVGDKRVGHHRYGHRARIAVGTAA